MNVTVAICTWNRCDLLRQTLEQMTQLRVPEGIEWELLVVNNNCTDATDTVIEEFTERLPLRRLFEPNAGLSHARNCAIEKAQGELLIWTDDDVLADENWLVEYVKAAEQWPEASYFGGTVDPWFEKDPPRWIKQNLDKISPCYAIRQLGSDTFRFREDKQPFGANMAFRTSIARKYHYNTRLGRKGKEMLSGDETDLLLRLKEDGLWGVWVGPAIVKHYIPSERLTRRYIWDYYAGIGRTYVCMSGDYSTSGKRIFGIPRWRMRQLATLYCTAWAKLLLRSSSWVVSYKKAAWAYGATKEASLRSNDSTCE